MGLHRYFLFFICLGPDTVMPCCSNPPSLSTDLFPLFFLCHYIPRYLYDIYFPPRLTQGRPPPKKIDVTVQHVSIKKGLTIYAPEISQTKIRNREAYRQDRPARYRDPHEIKVADHWLIAGRSPGNLGQSLEIRHLVHQSSLPYFNASEPKRI